MCKENYTITYYCKIIHISLLLVYPKVNILSLFSINTSNSPKFEEGHTLDAFFFLETRQVPHDLINPLFSTKILICSFTLNFLLLQSSASTPSPKKKMLVVLLFFKAAFPNLNAFQTFSGSFVFIIIPSFIVVMNQNSSPSL